jgi:hypothetical protein
VIVKQQTTIRNPNNGTPIRPAAPKPELVNPAPSPKPGGSKDGK